MIRMPKEPSTNVQAVMDDESYFKNICFFERFFRISWAPGGKVPERLEIQADSEKNCR